MAAYLLTIFSRLPSRPEGPAQRQQPVPSALAFPSTPKPCRLDLYLTLYFFFFFWFDHTILSCSCLPSRPERRLDGSNPKKSPHQGNFIQQRNEKKEKLIHTRSPRVTTPFPPISTSSSLSQFSSTGRAVLPTWVLRKKSRTAYLIDVPTVRT